MCVAIYSKINCHRIPTSAFSVRQKFHELLQEASTRLLVSHFPNLCVFFNYFEATWLHQFPPNIHSVYARQSNLRPIKAPEGYNKRFELGYQVDVLQRKKNGKT